MNRNLAPCNSHPHPHPSVNPPPPPATSPLASQQRVSSSPNSSGDGSCLDLGLYGRRSARRERRVVAGHHTDYCGQSKRSFCRTAIVFGVYVYSAQRLSANKGIALARSFTDSKRTEPGPHDASTPARCRAPATGHKFVGPAGDDC